MKDQATKGTLKDDVLTDVTQFKWRGTFDFEINMHKVPLEKGLQLSEKDLMMSSNSALQVNAYIDEKVVNDVVDWSSDNDNVTVTNGLVMTKAAASIGDSLEEIEFPDSITNK